MEFRSLSSKIFLVLFVSLFISFLVYLNRGRGLAGVFELARLDKVSEIESMLIRFDEELCILGDFDVKLNKIDYTGIDDTITESEKLLGERVLSAVLTLRDSSYSFRDEMNSRVNLIMDKTDRMFVDGENTRILSGDVENLHYGFNFGFNGELSVLNLPLDIDGAIPERAWGVLKAREGDQVKSADYKLVVKY